VRQSRSLRVVVPAVLCSLSAHRLSTCPGAVGGALHRRRCRACRRREADRLAARPSAPDRGGRPRAVTRARRARALMHLVADPEFWVLLAVIIFAAVVWKPARSAVVGGLDARAARIAA